MQGTVARRLFELLPPNRLAKMSARASRRMQAFKRRGTVNRIYQKTDLMTEEPDSDYIFDEEEEPIYTSCLKDPQTPEEILDLITFEGSPDLIRRLKEIVLKYIGCFETTLNKEPAHIPPMKLKVNNESAWKIPRHAGPDRQQTIVKQTRSLPKSVSSLTRVSSNHRPQPIIVK